MEKVIQNKDTTFSNFMIQACEHVLRDLWDKKKKIPKKVDFFNKIS
ncbi:hypothetical protein Sez_0305 [Streptococcus equi subsp. zooepidemicus MGCS10565]|uniref:Uncharacterized protein n=1 Tax=Streptococcus equi subsp. zooepidemicus (strain MGCS10565) TaxID=552526 RepID=B4U0Z4_STREM|nr:hypothetical protein Sez_0305 [Streptococcus equi subsp. zooepidemicus MGCS10565]